MLTSLDVGHNNLNEQAVLGIVRAARQHNKITNLGLSGCGVGPIGAKEIADYIRFTAVLKNCNLLKNGFNMESATMLAQIGMEKGIMLSGMTRFQTKADFSGQDLQPADGILIGSDLQFMAVLTTLRLDHNEIGAEGAIAIAEALKVTAVLTVLSLWLNKIGPEGAKAIAEALKVNVVLTNLDLDFNNIGDEGAKAIAEALKGNAVLTNLDLDRNNIGPKGAKAIAEALKGNAVLTTLYLGDNNNRTKLTKLDLMHIAGEDLMHNAGKKAVQDAPDVLIRQPKLIRANNLIPDFIDFEHTRKDDEWHMRKHVKALLSRNLWKILSGNSWKIRAENRRNAEDVHAWVKPRRRRKGGSGGGDGGGGEDETCPEDAQLPEDVPTDLIA